MTTVTRSYKAELVWRIRDALEEELRTNIEESDPSRPTLIAVGKYTDEIKGIILTVHSNHPLGFENGRVDAVGEGSPRTYNDRPYTLPSESIGGTQWDSILGTVQVRSLMRYTPSDAVEVIDMVKTRIAVVINDHAGIIPFVDPYGFQVWNLRTSNRYGYASGGDDTSVDTHWCDWIARVSRTRERD